MASFVSFSFSDMYRIEKNTTAWNAFFCKRVRERFERTFCEPFEEAIAKWFDGVTFQYDGPSTISYDGNLSPMLQTDRPRILVLGTIRDNVKVRQTTMSCIKALSQNERKPVILSTLSCGVGQIACSSANENGMQCVVSLPCGIDEMYPLNAETLANEIKQHGGAIVSSFPDKEHPSPFNIIARTRFLVAYSDALVIPACRNHGNAIVAAKLAKELNIDVYAVPGNPNEACFAGNNELISKGIAKILPSYETLKSL